MSKPRRRPTRRVGPTVYPRLDLTGVPLHDVVTGNCSREDFRPIVRSLGYPLRAVTPAITRFGRVYVIQLDGDRSACTVSLATRDGGTVTVALAADLLQRQITTVLEGVIAEYPQTSLTVAAAKALTAGLDLCGEHRLRGSRTVPRHDLEAAIAAPLLAFREAWHNDAHEPATRPERRSDQ